MTTLGFAQSLAALSCSLLAQNASFDFDSLLVSPWKLLLVLGWFCASLYLVQRVEESPLVPDRFRLAVQIASMFVGPLIFGALMWMDTKKSSSQRGGKRLAHFLEQLKNAFRRFWHPREVVEDPDAVMRLFSTDGSELSELYGHSDKSQANRQLLGMTVQLIENAIQQRASDILIDPKNQTTYAIRLRVDGTLRTVQEIPLELSRAIINSIKAVSNMDIAEKRRPQDGAFTAKKGIVTLPCRVATAGALNGEKISIRLLNQNAGAFTLTDVGVPAEQCVTITNAINKPSGMILICGPTGSGKTTTLYAMLNQIDRLTRNVITVEDPIESFLPAASQIEINVKADITFAKALRSILRQDPDVICVGEIRDEETANIALRAAQTGHLVLATVHADNNTSALVRLLDLGVSPLLMSSGLSLLVSQRLIRKLCEQCKQPARLSDSTLKKCQKSGILVNNIFDAVGCEACDGTGYVGRTAICDLMVITEELRTEIANGRAFADRLKTEGDKKGRITLRSEAIRHVVSGVTSLDEAKRVVG